MSEETKDQTTHQPETSKKDEFVKVNLLNAEDCPVIYANYASVTATPVDIQIVFGHFGEMAPSGQEINAKANVRIAMAPEHALLLMGVISNNLKAYVKQHGPLRNLPTRIQNIGPESHEAEPPKGNPSQP